MSEIIIVVKSINEMSVDGGDKTNSKIMEGRKKSSVRAEKTLGAILIQLTTFHQRKRGKQKKGEEGPIHKRQKKNAKKKNTYKRRKAKGKGIYI